MARHHAQILTSIWTNGNYTRLSSGAQRLYLLLLSQSDLTMLGTLPLSLKRWAGLSPDTTPAKVAKALAELEEHFVVVDRDTDEVWLRSFMRHDGVLKSPNSFKAACRAFPAVHSPAIREGIRDGLPEGLREGFPEGFLDVSPKALGELLKEGSLDHSVHREPGTGNRPPFPLPPETSSSSTASTSTRRRRLVDDDDDCPFDKRGAELFAAIVDKRMANATYESYEKYRATVETNLIAEQGPKITELAHGYPDAPLAMLVDHFEGVPQRFLEQYRVAS